MCIATDSCIIFTAHFTSTTAADSTISWKHNGTSSDETQVRLYVQYCYPNQQTQFGKWTTMHLDYRKSNEYVSMCCPTDIFVPLSTGHLELVGLASNLAKSCYVRTICEK